MFKALLLATVAGAGAANVPSPELIPRDSRHSQPLCSAVSSKCPGPKAQASVTAYCSSLLKPVTKTVRTTLYGTTTTTKTATVATVTQPGSVVTSTITSCSPPTTTAAPADNQKREAEPQNGYRHIPKPKCLDCYTKDSDVSSACQCAVSPSTTTVTSTYKMTVVKTATVSVSAALSHFYNSLLIAIRLPQPLLALDLPPTCCRLRPLLFQTMQATTSRSPTRRNHRAAWDSKPLISTALFCSSSTTRTTSWTKTVTSQPSVPRWLARTGQTPA